MKRLKNPWKRVPRGVKLALHAVFILCCLGLVLVYLDFPHLTAASAARSLLSDEDTLDLCVGIGEDRVLFLGEDKPDAHAMWVECQKKWRGWRVSKRVTAPAIAENVWCVPLFQEYQEFVSDIEAGFTTRNDSETGRKDVVKVDRRWRGKNLDGSCEYLCFAVKAPGSTASMMLYLDQPEMSDRLPAGQFPLVLKGAKNGWFVFGVDTEDLFEKHGTRARYSDAVYYEPSDPYTTLAYWLEWPGWYTGRVEFTTYDESGAAMQTYTMEVEYRK